VSYFLGELLSGGSMPGELLSTDFMSNQCLSTPVIYMWASLPSPVYMHVHVYMIYIWRCSLTAEADLCEIIQNVNWRERQGECTGECVCLMWCLFHVRSVKNCMSLDWIDDRLCHVAVVCI